MTNEKSKKQWTAADLEYFKQIILKKREETIKHIKQLESITVNDPSRQDNSTVDSAYAYHMADVGTDAQEREKAFFMLSRENKFLTHLNAALERIHTGEYGVCIECGELIPKERLEEVPHTQHCVQCKNKAKK